MRDHAFNYLGVMKREKRLKSRGVILSEYNIFLLASELKICITNFGRYSSVMSVGR